MNTPTENITKKYAADYIRLYDGKANGQVLIEMFDKAILEATAVQLVEIEVLKKTLNGVFDSEAATTRENMHLPTAKYIEESLAKSVQQILGYPDGSVLENVTKYHAYVSHEIKLLTSYNRAAVSALEKQSAIPSADHGE